MASLRAARRPFAAPLLLPLLLLFAASAAAIPLVSEGSPSIATASKDQILAFKEGEDQYVFEPLLSGSWARDRKFLRQLQESKCRPRRVLVSVSPPDAVHAATFSPDSVEVERCAGACGASRKACVATAVSTARVPVVLLAPGLNATAGHLLVQRHDACSCACATQPRDCSERQVYLAAECRCGCRTELQDEAKQCIAQPHWVWDDHSCRCDCRQRNVTCAHGQVWVPDLCQCRPFLPPDSEITNSTYDKKKST